MVKILYIKTFSQDLLIGPQNSLKTNTPQMYREHWEDKTTTI